MNISDISSILEYATEREASDVHLIAHQAPIFRIHGDLTQMEGEQYTPARLEKLLMSMLSHEQKEAFLRIKELDFSYSFQEKYQLRINLHYSEGNVAAAIRITPAFIRPYQELNLHPIVKKLAQTRKGIIILSGTAGSGKSTTMNCILDMINQERKSKIVTIEDPIEYHHKSKQSYFIQREVGKDTESFTNALKYALRQDPDVVCIGELRDLESMRIALTTAETGHLVITTVHASDSIGTLNRIVSVFPMGFREEVLAQLASNLVAVIYQTLLPLKNENRRILATEIMLGTMAVQNLIRRNDFKEIRGLLDAGETEGMYSLEVCLANLYKEDLISYETASENANYQHCQKLKEALNSKSKKLNFVILDQNINEIKLMGNALSKTYKGEVLFSETIKEGLPLIQKEKPDVVVLGAYLKDMNGFDACKKIKDMKDVQSKIILISSSYQPSYSVDAQNAGANDFVVKTQDYHLLIDAINKLFTDQK
ncbi:MAG: PilT/PilU family type 4a pilus ATPase [Candidatus Omnitrophica bacterium]|nr:PilT/PilU family type 4a pilus ATPase [Candidatus Omnitrophota bacterium]